MLPPLNVLNTKARMPLVYYLTLDESPVGEYGITVSNPNNIDEKMVIVSTFGIDGNTTEK